jgi:putative tryptophan/tyrosine transport system substrate-binding protein
MTFCIGRRAFITLLGGGAAAAWPLAARAQQPERVPRIGVLMASAADDSENQARMAAFLQGLAQLGWTDGRNIRIDTRWATTNPDDLRRHATELAALAPDVLVAASGTTTVAPLLQATRTVPIVFVQVSDPVGGGFVESLARPGGNITGLTSISVEMEGKRLELLREVVPKVSHIAVLWNAASPIQVIEEGEVRAAARVLGIKNAVSRSAPGRDRRRISDNHPGASRRAPSCSQIGCSCTIARASWTLPPKSACRGCMRTGNCLIVVRRTGIWRLQILKCSNAAASRSAARLPYLFIC